MDAVLEAVRNFFSRLKAVVARLVARIRED